MIFGICNPLTILKTNTGHSQQFSTQICTSDPHALWFLRSMRRQALLGQGVLGSGDVVWCVGIVNPWALMQLKSSSG